MKGKGFYTGAIALVAVALIAVVAFGMVSTVKAQGQKSSANAIVDAKWEWQNARHLLGKSAADALADGSNATGTGICTVDASLVQNYANAVLTGSLSNCTAITAPTIISNNVTISTTISCSKQLEGISTFYEKSTSFDKEVWTFDDGFDCFVDVRDNPSAICEVDTFAGGCGT